MRVSGSAARALAGFLCGLLSFTLFLPGWASWLGLLAALCAVTLGRFNKPQNKTQEYLGLGGLVLALLGAGLYLVLRIWGGGGL